MCQLYCCLTSPCLYGRLALNSLHQGIFQLPGQHLEVPRVTSGGSRRRECPASAKKPTRSPTGAVCRSCITLPVSTGASPTRRGNRNGFPESQVFGAGTLPVGVQGRSALLAPKERNPFADYRRKASWRASPTIRGMEKLSSKRSCFSKSSAAAAGKSAR